MWAKSLKELELRGSDDWGDGSFGASRGSRKHKGIDYKAEPGDEILSPCTGKVTKIGYPYAPKPGDKITYRYVEVTDPQGYRHRVFYIEPRVNMARQLNQGVVIGTAQDISGRYHDDDKEPMINHVHYEILDEEGEPVDPEGFA